MKLPMLLLATLLLVPLAAPAAYARLLTPEAWWDGQHTYSGDAKNLSLRAVPGGCFCERLADGDLARGLWVPLGAYGVAHIPTGFKPE